MERGWTVVLMKDRSDGPLLALSRTVACNREVDLKMFTLL